MIFKKIITFVKGVFNKLFLKNKGFLSQKYQEPNDSHFDFEAISISDEINSEFRKLG